MKNGITVYELELKMSNTITFKEKLDCIVHYESYLWFEVYLKNKLIQ